MKLIFPALLFACLAVPACAVPQELKLSTQAVVGNIEQSMQTPPPKFNRFAVAGPNSKYKARDSAPAGFWAGIWHGLIAFFALIIGIFAPGVGMYETNNTGTLYDLGFFLGIMASGGCLGLRRKYKFCRRCKND